MPRSYVYTGKPTTKPRNRGAKPARKSAKKTRWRLDGGPWDGKKIPLTTGGTLPISVAGWRGRYVQGPGCTGGVLSWCDL